MSKSEQWAAEDVSDQCRCNSMIARSAWNLTRFALSRGTHNYRPCTGTLLRQSVFIGQLVRPASSVEPPRASGSFSTYSMVQKSARSRKAAERGEGEDDYHQGATAAGGSNLTPKPCVTCGRQITPRAKWGQGDPSTSTASSSVTSEWDQVKTCSQTCRTHRPGKKTNQVIVGTVDDVDATMAEIESVEVDGQSQHALEALQKLLQAATESAKHKDSSSVEQDDNTRPANVWLDHDCLIELTLLFTAPSASSTSDVLPTTDQVEASIEGALSKSRLPTPSNGPLLRERVRRAARRLFTLDSSDWALVRSGHSSLLSDNIVEAEQGRMQRWGHGQRRGIDLLQNGKTLHGLQGASFAKGPIQFRRR